MYEQPSRLKLGLSFLFFFGCFAIVLYEWHGYPRVLALGAIQAIPLSMAMAKATRNAYKVKSSSGLNKFYKSYRETRLWIPVLMLMLPLGILLGGFIPDKTTCDSTNPFAMYYFCHGDWGATFVGASLFMFGLGLYVFYKIVLRNKPPSF